jgi:hypothetical protein
MGFIKSTGLSQKTMTFPAVAYCSRQVCAIFSDWAWNYSVFRRRSECNLQSTGDTSSEALAKEEAGGLDKIEILLFLAFRL